ncbi:type I phosphomannose isomerase catalytic subunit [Butyrivibrio sp. MC2021]|uniref:type I phosphomannose isomerase catalytic subunit n=1 Tax=Butyrivibrio sp. MC2021 TaxID=1408306 RepID=UPI00047B0176|nr:type I phosphomannose isomerase catalytic subunit [Butyrivibrio sp. MC2021]
MEMFKLIPACKDYLWGGHRLASEYGIKYDGDILAEAWVLACHKDGSSIIADGEFAGKSLDNVRDEIGWEFLGTNCKDCSEFPILIKFIDAKRALSIQVHPDDEYANANENQPGKTEMWYVLDANEDSYLYQGFDHEITREEFEERIKSNTLTEVLNKVKVKKGDVLFIPPKTLHAIGEGIIIAEIQQNSNVTYRIYDYGRLGADGKPRQLHIKQSLDVTSLKRPEPYTCTSGHLVSCDFFDVDHVIVTQDRAYEEVADERSFVSIIAIEGKSKVSCGGKTVLLEKGESLFIPASSGKYTVTGDSEILITRIPEHH